MPRPMPENPAHKHDCDACIFVGQDALRHHENGRAVDMYVCKVEPGGYTLIRRWSSDGPEYGAMPAELAEHFGERKWQRVIDAAKAKGVL